MEKKSEHPALGKPPRKSKAPKQLAVIDQKGCTGCQVCIALCPVDCIEKVPGVEHPDFMSVVEVDVERCIGCSICADFCPWETILMVSEPLAEAKVLELTLRSILYEGVGEMVGETEKPPLGRTSV